MDKEHRDKEHRHGENRHGGHRDRKDRDEKHRQRENHYGEHRHGEHRLEDDDFWLRVYQYALQQFSEKSGSHYPCKQSEIDFHYRGVFDKPNKGPFVTATQATQEIMRWNDEKRAPPQEELIIIRRLTNAIHDATKDMRFAPDLLIKTAADLDRVFFGGRLRGNILVKWVGIIEGYYGFCRSHKHGQPRIELNAEIFLIPSWRKYNPVVIMFSTMLHEMCHAYERVRCPSRGGVDGRKGGHDVHFATKIRVIHDRAIRILGTCAIMGHEKWIDVELLSDKGEKSRKAGTGGGDGGKKKDGGEKDFHGTKCRGPVWGSRKGTDCVIM